MSSCSGCSWTTNQFEVSGWTKGRSLAMTVTVHCLGWDPSDRDFEEILTQKSIGPLTPLSSPGFLTTICYQLLSGYYMETPLLWCYWPEPSWPTQGQNEENSSLFDKLRDDFKTAFTSSQRLVTDESLVLWREKMSFHQNISSKWHKYGFKLFVLCDYDTWFVQDVILYTDKHSNLPEDRLHVKSGAVVQHFVKR